MQKKWQKLLRYVKGIIIKKNPNLLFYSFKVFNISVHFQIQEPLMVFESPGAFGSINV